MTTRFGWSGFSTGEWEGDTLVQTATHLIEAYIRRWGPMRSDQATGRTAAGQKLPPRSGPQDDGRVVRLYEPRLGGPETMYPEYIAKMKSFPRPKTVAGGGERGQ